MYIFPCERFVGLIKFKVVLDIIIFLIDLTGYFAGDIHKGSIMKLIILKKKGQGKYLQHQETKEIEISPDEEKNVTHK